MGLRFLVAPLVVTLFSTQVLGCCGPNDSEPCVTSITPNVGPVEGHQRLTITGCNFNLNAFSLGGQTSQGNQVLAYSSTRSYYLLIHPDGSHERQITVDTVPMVQDTYRFKVTVASKEIPPSKMCNCVFRPHSKYTPLIKTMDKHYGTPDDLVCFNGTIFTDKYGTNVANSTNGNQAKILRVWVTGGECELKKPDSDEFYKLALHSNTSDDGAVCCKPKTTYVGYWNTSIVIDTVYGGSTPEPAVVKINKDDGLYMKEISAYISSVTPQKGSTEGGTEMTITGDFFDNTDTPIEVLVGGVPATNIKLNSQKQIIFETPAKPSTVNKAGNRGMLVEIFNHTGVDSITDAQVSQLTDPPVWSTQLDESELNLENNFGNFRSRQKTFYTVPKDSKYTFMVLSDGEASLYYSTDGNPDSKTLAGTNTNTVTHFWQSKAKTPELDLKKNDKVYLEVIQKHSAVNATMGIGVQIDHSLYTASQTSQALNKKYKVQTASTVKNEIQRLTFSGLKTSSGRNEKVQINILSSAPSFFCLAFNGISGTTGVLPVVDLTSDTVAKALNMMPLFADNPASASVKDISGGKQIIVTLPKGNYPDMVVQKVSGSFTSTVSFQTQGQSSGSNHQFKYGSAVSPVFSPSNINTMSTALNDIFKVRCPLYITSKFGTVQTAVRQDFEDDTELSSGTRTYEVQPFCGRYSSKNPSLLVNSTYSASQYSTLCFAFRGIIKNEMYVVYSENGVRRGLTFPAFDGFTNEVISDSQSDALVTWRFRCVKLLDEMKKARPTIPTDIDILEVRVNKENALQDLYVDTVLVITSELTYHLNSQGIPAGISSSNLKNLIQYERMRPPKWLNKELQVVKITTGTYDVNITILDCHHNLPYLEIFNAEVTTVGSKRTSTISNIINMGTEILQAASLPITGTVGLSVGSHQLYMNAQAEAAELGGAISQLDRSSFGDITVYRSGDCAGYKWILEFTTSAGNKPDISVFDDTRLTGNKQTVTASTIQNGGMLQYPIPGGMLSTAHHSVPQVTVSINSISSNCTGDCNFEWTDAQTPTLSASTPASGSESTSLTLTGTGFSTNNADNVVIIGGVACTTIQSTGTSITCNIGKGPVGSYKINVKVVGHGYVLHDGGTHNFEYNIAFSSITPTTGSLAGGAEVTVSGSGFNNQTMVKIDSKDCPSKSQTYDTIVCTVPSGSNTGTAAVTMVSNGKTATNNAVTFTYEASAATISTLSTNTASTNGNTALTISGTGFGASKPANGGVTVGNKVATVVKWSDTSIEVTLPAHTQGVYNLGVKVSDKGYAAGNKQISYYLEVTNVYPIDISLMGGSLITLTGKGFGSAPSNLDIKFGDILCTVKTVQDTKIICEIARFGKTHEVNNQGIHKTFGEGFQWTPADLSAEEGDIIQWTWTSPNSVSDIGYRVAMTKNLSSEFDLIGDNIFSSGPNKTANGSMSYEVVYQSQYYYYWSGPINSYGNIITWGAFKVLESKDRAKYLKLSLSGVEAQYKLAGSAPSITCPNHNKATDSTCSGNIETDSNFESTHFKLQSRKCITPTITNISPRIVPGTNGNQDITITGTGFVNDANCPIKVFIEKDILKNAECTVLEIKRNGGVDTLFCKVSSCDALPIGVPLRMDVLVGNTGFALHKQINPNLRAVTFMPVITSIAPAVGSLGGGTQLTIQGTRFMSNTSSPCGSQSSSGRKKRSTLHLYTLNGGNPNTLSLSLGSLCSSLQTVSSSKLICTTTPAPASHLFSPYPQQISTVSLNVITASQQSIPASCTVNGGCTLTKSRTSSPEITGIYVNTNVGLSPGEGGKITANGQVLTITGTKLGDNVNLITIKIGNALCTASSTSNAQVLCTTANLVAGVHPITYLLYANPSQSNAVSGYAIITGKHGGTTKDFSAVTVQGSITSVSHTDVGTAGCVLLNIVAFGLHATLTTVTVGGQECKIDSVSPTTVTCETPALAAGTHTIKVKVNGLSIGTETITYSINKTPTLSSVNPTTGTTGDSITISGSNFGTELNKVSVVIGNATCTVIAVTSTDITCALGDRAAGDFDIKVKHVDQGCATGTVSFSYVLEITTISPNTGSTGGGQVITLTGKGFGTQGTTVKICGNDCIVKTSTLSSTNIECTTPAVSSTQQCDVVVANSDGKNTPKVAGYNYNISPKVTGVSPSQGGTGGGTMVTITGTGFGNLNSDVGVKIAGAVCDIQGQVTDTQIICQTNAHKPSEKAKVEVRLTSTGIAYQQSADFEYIDVWSSKFTWNNTDPPGAGTLVVIPSDMTVLLDQDTPVLKVLLIQGGTVRFENKASAQLTLNAEIILITDGGRLEVGTEVEPYKGNAVIKLHGHVRAKELPIYGTKCLAMRNGTLELHGKDVTKTWTQLASTAAKGATSITVQDDISGWEVGDEISIATTGHFLRQRESEQRTISAISGKTISFTKPLEYEHLGETRTYDNRVLQVRAEVGRLTRNVKVMGSEDDQFTGKVEACDSQVKLGQFATQTCFQGKFGEEMGSDEFGAQIIMHTPYEGAIKAHIENVELTYVGQAFRLGRYAVHFHLNGDMQGSYVRKCAIHRSFNRATNIHGTHNIMIEWNVAYNIKGGAFFLEDGIETGNTFQYNLAIKVVSSSSLQNDDITPAAYWLTNANNTVRHNHAAGGSHFGVWYRMHEHPDAASYDPDVCPQNIPLKENGFVNNTVHSQGWFGIWIFMIYTPRECASAVESCKATKPKAAIFKDLTAWNCEKCAESVGGSAIQFHDFFCVNNDLAGHEFKLVLEPTDPYTDAGGTMVKGGMVVAYDNTLQRDGFKDHFGIIFPQGLGFRLQDVTFVNFDKPNNAIGKTADVQGSTSDNNGGYLYYAKGIKKVNSPNLYNYKWLHDAVLVDEDGSLTGTSNNKIVPTMGTLPPNECTHSAFASLGVVEGSICGPSVSLYRFSLNKYLPTSLEHKQVVLRNIHGSTKGKYHEKGTSHKLGWTVLLVGNMATDIWFEGADQLTNLSYRGVIFEMPSGGWVILNHPFHQNPDRFTITGNVSDRVGSPTAVSFANNAYGDWSIIQKVRNGNTYYDSSVLVTGKLEAGETADFGDYKHRNVDLQVYKCYYPECEAPPDPSLTPVDSLTRPTDYVLYHDKNVWIESRESTSNTLLGMKQFSQLSTDKLTGAIPPDNSNIEIDKVTSWRPQVGTDLQSFFDQSSLAQFCQRDSSGAMYNYDQSTDRSVSETWMVVNRAGKIILDTIKVYGFLELEYQAATTQTASGATDSSVKSMIISVHTLLMAGGRLFCGWKGKLMENEITIELRGNTFTPGINLNSGPNLGSKAIGVFGGVEMHGQIPSHTWLRLSATAKKGSSEIFLTDSPNWKVGNEIAIAGTSFSPYETEKKLIKAIQGNKIELDSILKFTHIGGIEQVAPNVNIPMGAEVGLLSRNIKIVGMDYNLNGNPGGMAVEGFGGRVLVGRYVENQETKLGYARIRHVEFQNMGQEGWSDFYDPRYSIAYLDAGDVESIFKPSELTGCSFNENFNTAIGVYGTNSLTVSGNVVYNTAGSSVIVWGNQNKVQGNMVVGQLYSGTWNGRSEERDTWQAAMELQQAIGVIVENNAVSGYERAGYRVDGVKCESPLPTNPAWSNNYAHSGLAGVIMLPDQGDGINPCSHLNNFIAYKNYDFGMYLQTEYSLVLSNNILLDNNVGLLPYIYRPPAVDHLFANKDVQIIGGHIVGKSSSFDCSVDQLFTSDPRVAKLLDFSPRGRSWNIGKRGTIGVVMGTFSSGPNNAPLKPWSGIMAYNALYGKTTMQDTTFKNFGQSCQPGERDYCMGPPPFNDDAITPMYLRNVQKLANVNDESLAYISDPSLGLINPSDCVDMDCDGLKQFMIKDLDGSFLDAAGAVVIPKSEKFWDADKRRGLGDFRIPKVLQVDSAGKKIQFAGHGKRGIYKDDSCLDRPTYNGYKCRTLGLEQLIFESMDSDTETRRLSPIGTQSGVTNPPSIVCPDCYVDLVNGPQDHGWCMGYTCQKRMSTFHIMVPTNKYTHFVLTGTTPKNIRLHFPNAASSEACVVGIWYARPNRLDVYDETTFVKGTNAQLDSQGRLITTKPSGSQNQFIPKLTDAHGTNYFDRAEQFLYVTLKGGNGYIDIKTSEQIVVNFAVPSMTVDEFFTNNLVRNLASFFDIPADKISVAHAVRDTSSNGRKKRNSDILLIITISNPPANLTNVNPSDLTADQLNNITQQFINTYQLGELGQVLNLNILSFQITQPMPQTDTEAWKTFAVLQQSARIDVNIPSSVKIVQDLIPIHEGATFLIQPSLQMVDSSNTPIADLGSLLAPWQITASLVTVNSPWSANVQLLGTGTVKYNSSFFNFTDLAISHAGTYKIEFIVSEPTTATHFKVTSKEFIIKDRALAAGIVSQPDNVTTGESFDVVLQLIDDVTKEKIANIAWKGHTWSATISMFLPNTFSQGTLTGPTNAVAVDPSTGYANFSGLSINAKGRYFVGVHYVTSPAGYDFVTGADRFIDVLPTDYTMPTIDKHHRIRMKFFGNFADVENRTIYFAASLHNKLSADYPNLLFSNYSAYSGSIMVEFNAAGSSSDLKSMLDNHWKQVQEGGTGFSFTYNGTTYTSDTVMWVNGDQYGDKEGHKMPLWLIVLIVIISVTLVGLIIGFCVYKYYRSRMNQKNFELEKREPTMQRRGLTMIGKQDDYYHVPEDQGSSSSLSSGSRHGDDEKLILSQAPKSTAHFDFLNVRPRTSYQAPNLLPPLESEPNPLRPESGTRTAESSRPTSTTYLNLQLESSLSPPQ